MIIHLNEHRFSKLFLTESKNSKRAHQKTREILGQHFNEDPNSEFIASFEQTLIKKYFGEGKNVDWFIVLEPNITMWLLESPGPLFEKYIDYLFKKATTFKKPSEYIAKVRPIETFEELKQFVDPQMAEDRAREREEMKKMGVNLNDNYEVLGPLSYDEAQQYGNYSGLEFGSRGRICYTQNIGTWNSTNYSNNGKNSCFLLLRNDWRTVSSTHDGSEKNNGLDELQYNGYDDYGLSMIFVWITPEGELHECNTRWNHEAQYAPGHSVDNALNEVDIAKLMGAPFEKIFNIRVITVEEKDAEINQRLEKKIKLAEGDINYVFDDIGDTFGVGIFVRNGGRWNLLDAETKSKLLLPVWFDDVIEETDDYFFVSYNRKPNVITKEGRYLWNHPFKEWFDVISISESPYFPVRKNNKYNFLKKEDGNLLCNDVWFDGIDGTRWKKFGKELAYCPVWIGTGNDKRYNLLAYTGNMLWPYSIAKWFDECWTFEENDYLVIGIKGKMNIVAPNGKFLYVAPESKWFDYIEGNPFNHGGVPFALVGMKVGEKENSVISRPIDIYKYNLLKNDGTLLYNESPENWLTSFVGDDLDFFGKGNNNYCRVKNEKGKVNLININGELVWKGDEWFETISPPSFYGVCLVKKCTSDGSYYNVLIGYKGVLISDTWFKYAARVSGGFQLTNDNPLGENPRILFVSGKGEITTQ